MVRFQTSSDSVGFEGQSRRDFHSVGLSAREPKNGFEIPAKSKHGTHLDSFHGKPGIRSSSAYEAHLAVGGFPSTRCLEFENPLASRQKSATRRDTSREWVASKQAGASVTRSTDKV